MAQSKNLPTLRPGVRTRFPRRYGVANAFLGRAWGSTHPRSRKRVLGHPRANIREPILVYWSAEFWHRVVVPSQVARVGVVFFRAR